MTDATPEEVQQITEYANALGRSLSFFQFAKDKGFPALMLAPHVRLIRENSLTLETMLTRYSAQELGRIHLDVNPNISDEHAALLAEAEATGMSDTIPDNWEYLA